MSYLALTERLYAALNQNDLPAIWEVLAPDVAWLQTPGLPEGPRQIGAEIVLHEVLARFRTEWTDWHVVVHQCLESGSAVIVLGEFRGRSRDTDQALVAPFAHVLDFQEGRVVRIRQYADAVQDRDSLEAREDLAEHGVIPPAVD